MYTVYSGIEIDPAQMQSRRFTIAAAAASKTLLVGSMPKTIERQNIKCKN